MRLYEFGAELGVEKSNLNFLLQYLQQKGCPATSTIAIVDDQFLEIGRKEREKIVKYIATEVKNKIKKPVGKIGGRLFQKKNSTAAPAAEDAAKKKKDLPPITSVANKVLAHKKEGSPTTPTKKSPPVVSAPPKKKVVEVVPLPRPAPVVRSGTVTIEQDSENAENREISASSFKHKRADFRTLNRPELPSLFASGDGEYTRSLRQSSAPTRRRESSRDNRHHHRKGHQQSSTRTSSVVSDPNAKAQLAKIMSVRELSENIGVKINEIIGYLMRDGQMTTANDILDQETIELIATQFKISYEWEADENLEDTLAKKLDSYERKSSTAKHHDRAPIITFMGHVDHGKTSLLDKIRATRVVDTEHGGITQHIGAYTIDKEGRKITFLDTPGHEAFTQMRARGANLTDVVVLVVAADDGVMPQTKEACAHAKNAGVPIVVAINKCDIAGANPERVKQELATQLELLPEAWGGTIGVVEVSAITGQGIDNLLERILLEAEMLELSADPQRHAVGFVIESKMTDNRGAVATILISDGTLYRGDVLITSNGYGKVRLMYGWNGEMCESGGPSDAVSVVGLNNVPEVGEKIYVVDDIITARKLAEERESRARAQVLLNQRRRHVSLENLMEHLGQDGKRSELNVIIKADVSGSLEVLQKTLTDLATDEVGINIIHSGVGGISQADVILADASDALVVGFHVVADSSAKFQAATLNVQIKVYHVIYRLIEDLKAALEGMLPKAAREVVSGHAEVREVFRASKIGTIAGCYIIDGMINRKCRMRLIRDSVVIYDGALESLKRFKDDVREVRTGFECGIKITNYDDIRQGDTIEGYEIEEVARKL